MDTVGSYEAKTHLPRLLDEVESGETFIITKHGRPVARLVGLRGTASHADLVAEFRRTRAGLRLGLSVAELRAEGRR